MSQGNEDSNSWLQRAIGYLTSGAIALVGALAINIVFAQTLTVSDRGKLAVALHSVYLIGTFVAGGLERTTGTMKSELSFGQILSFINVLTRRRFTLAAIVGIVTCLASFLIFPRQISIAVALVLVTGLGNAALLGVKSASLASGETLRYGAITVLTQLGILSAVAVSVLLAEPTWLILLAGLAMPYCLLVGYVYGRTSVSFPEDSIQSARRTARQYGTGFFATRIAMRADRFLLPLLASTTELGRYVVPAGVAEVAVQLTNTVSESLMPHLTSRDENGRLRVRTIVLALLAVFLVVSIGTGIVLYVAVGPIFGERYSPSIQLAVALGLGTGALASSMTCGNTLATMQHSSLIGRAEVVGAVLALLCYVALIPSFGAEGAAVAAAIAYAITCLVQIRGLVVARRFGTSEQSVELA